MQPEAIRAARSKPHDMDWGNGGVLAKSPEKGHHTRPRGAEQTAVVEDAVAELALQWLYVSDRNLDDAPNGIRGWVRPVRRACGHEADHAGLFPPLVTQRVPHGAAAELPQPALSASWPHPPRTGRTHP